jgi:hypothetical protein
MSEMSLAIRDAALPMALQADLFTWLKEHKSYLFVAGADVY